MSESPGHASGKLARWLASGGGVAITGASGWVGRAMAHLAIEALGPGASTRLRLFGSSARPLELMGRIHPLETLHDAAPLGPGEWLVMHLAVVGPRRLPDREARRLINEAMLADVLALAGTGQVRRLVSASSGAVYAPPRHDPDLQAYDDLKRDQESIVRAWSAKTGVPALFPRIFNLGGPYMNRVDRYLLGALIRQAMVQGSVRIEARRPVLRSYVHVLELAQVTYALALSDHPTLAFDTAGEEVLETAELVAAIGRALDLPNLVIDRAPMDAGAEADRYVGDGSLYRTALAGAAQVGIDKIVRDTAAWLRTAGEL